MATQLLLGLAPAHEPSFENFVVGDNREVVERIVDLVQSRAPGAIFLWGPAGSGKSHLLAAATRAATRRPWFRLDGETEDDLLELRGGTLVIVDDVDQLDDGGQRTLFRVFNAARITGTSLLLAASRPPLALTLREDLRTRLGQCLVLQLAALSEAERCAALERHAAQRGMRLPEGLVAYLIRHGRRDLPTLLATLDRLDRASLEQKRQPTVPMLRDLLQQDAFTLPTP